jgi:hypothetical protein
MDVATVNHLSLEDFSSPVDNALVHSNNYVEANWRKRTISCTLAAVAQSRVEIRI